MKSTFVRKTSPVEKTILALLLSGFLALVVANAWLSDDAYITFRTVDNFIHGYGLTWNTTERVQVYTHPLWMFLLSGAYALTGEIYFTSIALSIIISLGAVYLVVVRGAQTTVMAALAVLIAGLSKASVDYATSGLENPLTHLILGGFLLLYTAAEATPRRVFWLALLAALGMVNRLDTALIFGPALLWTVIESRHPKSLGLAVLGGLPLILWELFALFYYGSPFPNTALAKLNAGIIPSAELWTAGLDYLVNSLRVDPLTLSTIAVSVGWVLVARAWRKAPLVIGVATYVVYTVRIGGDFMSGRFLTAPFCVALFLVVHTAWCRGYPAQVAVLVILVLVGLNSPYTPLRASGVIRADEDADIWIRGRGITDERANYYVNTGLLKALSVSQELPNHDWAISGREARVEGQDVAIRGSVGFYGFFAGPDVHVVDILGLGDPLLARLPVIDPKWRIGHYGRRPPEGYIDTLEAGRNLIVDPNLAAYYDRLAYVTQGDLWDPTRWREIWRFNTGTYEPLLESYAYHEGPTLIRKFDVVNVTGQPFVYTYVWNNGAGDVIMLDSDAKKGDVYPVRWTISASGVAFDGDYEKRISSIGPLSDNELLNVGVILSSRPDFEDNEMYERRYWFRIVDGGKLKLVLPPLEWHNADGPDGFWEETDVDLVMRPAS